MFLLAIGTRPGAGNLTINKINQIPASMELFPGITIKNCNSYMQDK